jgi:hypothetical protein
MSHSIQKIKKDEGQGLFGSSTTAREAQETTLSAPRGGDQLLVMARERFKIRRRYWIDMLLQTGLR